LGYWRKEALSRKWIDYPHEQVGLREAMNALPFQSFIPHMEKRFVQERLRISFSSIATMMHASPGWRKCWGRADAAGSRSGKVCLKRRIVGKGTMFFFDSSTGFHARKKKKRKKKKRKKKGAGRLGLFDAVCGEKTRAGGIKEDQ